MTEKKVIYIGLLNEGTDVWRPTLGEMISDNIFKVLPTDDYDPDLEEWEFVPGVIVECELRSFKEGHAPKEVLVAIRKAKGLK